MSDSTDASLLQRLRKPGEKEAWDRFVALYLPLVRIWAARFQATGVDAEDLVQEVFAGLVRSIPQFEYSAQGRFRGWLWTTTKNKWRELLRRRVPLGRSCSLADDCDCPQLRDRVSTLVFVRNAAVQDTHRKELVHGPCGRRTSGYRGRKPGDSDTPQ